MIYVKKIRIFFYCNLPTPLAHTILMLKSRRGPLESKDQKLLSLIVLNYLETDVENDDIDVKPFSVPKELLIHVNTFNASIIMGTNFITYSPNLVFLGSDLKKLKELKSQISKLKEDLKFRKEESGFKMDTEITTAHKTYMEQLHRYNEVKDVAQALLGNLAQLTGRTTKDLYPNFNLSFED